MPSNSDDGSSTKSGEILVPAKPPFLVGPAGVEWFRVVGRGASRTKPAVPGLLVRSGLWRAEFLGPVAVYCAAYGDLVRCQRVLNSRGYSFAYVRRAVSKVEERLIQEGAAASETGAPVELYVQIRPEVTVRRQAMETIMRVAAEFGLTASAIGRIEFPGDGEGDEFTRKFGG